MYTYLFLQVRLYKFKRTGVKSYNKTDKYLGTGLSLKFVDHPWDELAPLLWDED